jgi:hypothetical protein
MSPDFASILQRKPTEKKAEKKPAEGDLSVNFDGLGFSRKSDSEIIN